MAAGLKLLILIFVQTLMDWSCYYFPQHFQHYHILQNYHGDFMMTKSDKQNHQHLVLKDIVTLLAGASALCISTLIVFFASERE